MHELSLCRNLIDIIQEEVRVKKYNKVKCIILEIGALACVEKQALLFSFDIVAKGTVAEQAILQFIEIPAEAKCKQCENIFVVTQYAESCKKCGNMYLEIIKGKDLLIKEMEVE